MTYTINLTSEAKADFDDLYFYIAYELHMPETADKYTIGIYRSIAKLVVTGGIYAPGERESIQKRYGPNARTITFKKMVIVFNVIGNIVLIRRVFAGSLVR
jgi:plasmid stabilization system protein ParE